MMAYFGEPHDAPIYAEVEQVATPVGEPCVWCEELIEAGEEGWRYSNGPVAHYACFMRQVLGGVNHQRGTCSCCGGADPTDPPGLTPREAAQAALEFWQAT